jgi:hypothetical protein
MGQQPDGTDGTDSAAPPVSFEPCAGFRSGQGEVWPVCAACGWLEDDHAADECVGAVVTELPRRRVRLPERKAS